MSTGLMSTASELRDSTKRMLEGQKRLLAKVVGCQMISIVLKRGTDGSVGVSVYKEGPGPFVVTRLVEGGAAALDGRIKLNDILHAVDTTSVYGLNTEQVKTLLRGSPEVDVTLWIEAGCRGHSTQSMQQMRTKLDATETELREMKTKFQQLQKTEAAFTALKRELMRQHLIPWEDDDDGSRLPGQWVNVRIFLSSSFVDTQAERDMIVKKVVPRLNFDLQEYYIRVTVVDLRCVVCSD